MHVPSTVSKLLGNHRVVHTIAKLSPSSVVLTKSSVKSRSIACNAEVTAGCCNTTGSEISFCGTSGIQAALVTEASTTTQVYMLAKILILYVGGRT